MIKLKSENNSAQVVIESTLGLIAIFIFIFGVTRLFVWFTKCYKDRQVAYEDTRIVNPHPIHPAFNNDNMMNFYIMDEDKKLHIFEQEKN